MVRGMGRLTAFKVSKAQKPGLYADGGGLYLQVSGGGARSWVMRYMLDRKARTMGLGSLSAVGLADARRKASEARALLADGKDPITARDAALAAARLDAAKAITFKECAEKYIEAYKPAWRNDKHAAQWSATLKTYVYPTIGGLSAQAIDTGLVHRVLQPIWTTKTETAGRLRGRIEAVLDWASVNGYRTGVNPARWRGNLAKLLPAQSKVQKIKHHPALPYDELPEFMEKLRKQGGHGARALELLILTATRTGETLGATWPEIDLNNALWIIPADRMKGGREHRVPLPPAAVTILEAQKKVSAADDFVFPSRRKGVRLSDNVLRKVMQRMKCDDHTPHGFRSTFRDWAAERTNYPREVAEACLAHAIGDKVEAAYRRGDLLEKRRRLMSEWAKFCMSPKAKGEILHLRGE